MGFMDGLKSFVKGAGEFGKDLLTGNVVGAAKIAAHGAGVVIKGTAHAVVSLGKDVVNSVKNQLMMIKDGASLGLAALTGNKTAMKNNLGKVAQDGKNQFRTLVDVANNGVVQAGLMIIPGGVAGAAALKGGAMALSVAGGVAENIPGMGSGDTPQGGKAPVNLNGRDVDPINSEFNAVAPRGGRGMAAGLESGLGQEAPAASRALTSILGM